MLRTAGFDEPKIEEVAVHFTVPDVDAYLDFVGDTAGPIGLTIQRLGRDDHAALADVARDQLAPSVTADGLDVPGLALCACAERTAQR